MIDLRELLDERSANPPSPEVMRLAQIEKRISRRRRLRVAAIAAVVLVFFGGYALRPAPDPAPPLATFDFPQWRNGARLVGATSVPLKDGRASITWTPTSLDITPAVSCGPQTRRPRISVLTTGTHEAAGLSCGEGISSSRYRDEREWRDGGLKVGESATLTAVSDGTATGTLSFAVYEQVPFGEYPLPTGPDPATIKAVSCPLPAGRTAVRSDPGDPRKPMSVTIDWSDYIAYHAVAQTPGLLRIDIEGLPLDTVEFWDYDAKEAGSVWYPGSARLLKPGDRVTLTLTPEYFTGPWTFWTHPTDGTWSTDCPT